MKIFLLVLLLIILAGGGYGLVRQNSTDTISDQATTTSSDTTSPPSSTNGMLTLALRESGTVDGVTITVTGPVNDSRCPKDVQCVWAGTVTVGTTINSAVGESSQKMELGRSVTTEAHEVTLIDVTPYPTSGVEVPDNFYRFTFEVVRR